MRYTDLSDIGGFLWWLLIKQCKSNLVDERKEEKWARNIFFLILLGVFIGFISTKFFV